MPNIDTILRDHVTLKLECLDRLYLNGYQPLLQTEGGLLHFLLVHRKQRIPSPALLGQMTRGFVAAIESFAEKHHIPLVHFEKGQRKEDIAKQHFARFSRPQGVVFIGVAQEKVKAFRSFQERRPGWKRPCFRFYRGFVFVKQFYVYVLDRDFGPPFVKFSSYCPFTVRIWLNGHEWAKRQFQQAGIRFESLDNGFLSVSDPTRAQAICDRLKPADIEAFFRRGLARLPHPFTRIDRAAGYRYHLSILQMEVSRRAPSAPSTVGSQQSTGVLALSTLDCGLSTRGAAALDRRISRRTPGSFRTRVLTVGVEPTLRVTYKNCSIKQYFKLGRALRTETTFNDTRDFGVGRDLHNLDHLRRIGRNANRRLLTVERLSHNCAISSGTFERIVLPASDENGQHRPGLRFGEPRVRALLAALCLHLHLPNGFSNRTLRGAVAALQGKDPAHYSPGQMSYDLRPLRLKGLIRRLPASHRYLVTPAGRRIALFFSKTYARVLRPGLDRLDAPPPFEAPDPLKTAWSSLDQALSKLVQDARLAA